MIESNKRGTEKIQNLTLLNRRWERRVETKVSVHPGHEGLKLLESGSQARVTVPRSHSDKPIGEWTSLALFQFKRILKHSLHPRFFRQCHLASMSQIRHVVFYNSNQYMSFIICILFIRNYLFNQFGTKLNINNSQTIIKI